jgi:hypothetical protein
MAAHDPDDEAGQHADDREDGERDRRVSTLSVVPLLLHASHASGVPRFGVVRTLERAAGADTGQAALDSVAAESDDQHHKGEAATIRGRWSVALLVMAGLGRGAGRAA